MFSFSVTPEKELRVPEHTGENAPTIRINRVEIPVDTSTGWVGLIQARATRCKKDGTVGKVHTTSYLMASELPKWFLDQIEREYKTASSKIHPIDWSL